SAAHFKRQRRREGEEGVRNVLLAIAEREGVGGGDAVHRELLEGIDETKRMGGVHAGAIRVGGVCESAVMAFSPSPLRRGGRGEGLWQRVPNPLPLTPSPKRGGGTRQLERP